MSDRARPWSILVTLLVLTRSPNPAANSKSVQYRNTDTAVAYVGSKSCGASGCHEQVCRTYPQTPMGSSMDLATRPSELGKVPETATVFKAGLNRYFEVFRQESGLFQSEYQVDADGKVVFKTTHKLEYVVGAGMNGYTYIIRRGNHFFEAPLSYYSQARKWDLSPGYEAADAGFNRPILSGCLACHNGQPEAVPKREALYRDPPFRFGELAIGCECCHGPGQLHNEEMKKRPRRLSRSQVDTSIVDPAKLPPRLADDVCMNCHQGGHTRVLQPGKDYLDFRPGTPLYLTSAIFKLPLKREQREAADRAQVLPPVRGSLEMPTWWKNSSMELSRCYQASSGRLSCVTCHKIHGPPTELNRAAYYRRKCFTCHTNASCRLPLPERSRHKPANDCAGCHMPKRPVGGIPHSALTNHRIMRRPGQPLPETAFGESTPGVPGLVLLNGLREGQGETLPGLTRLAAYGELTKIDPSLHGHYLAMLDELSRSAPGDPLVLATLGRKALFENDNARAVDYLSRALERGSEATTTYLDLSEALARVGRLEESVEVLQRGIGVAPYAVALHKALAHRYIMLKQYPRAHEVMKRYMELFPEDTFMRGLLEKVETPPPSR